MLALPAFRYSPLQCLFYSCLFGMGGLMLWSYFQNYSLSLVSPPQTAILLYDYTFIVCVVDAVCRGFYKQSMVREKVENIVFILPGLSAARIYSRCFRICFITVHVSCLYISLNDLLNKCYFPYIACRLFRGLFSNPHNIQTKGHNFSK